MLPEMNGFEVARRARASGNYVPILIVTAKDDARDRVRGIEEGADDYLTKPFTLGRAAGAGTGAAPAPALGRRGARGAPRAASASAA